MKTENLNVRKKKKVNSRSFSIVSCFSKPDHLPENVSYVMFKFKQLKIGSFMKHTLK